MCGRYVSPDEGYLERLWHIGRHNNNPFARHYNVAPTVQVPIIYPGDDGLELSSARWGLVPFWWKQPKLPPFTFNARIEEAATKPMWRNAVKSARCLIPAIGWYEWKPLQVVDPVTGEIKTAKQPYFLHLAGKPAFAFAGLMSRYTKDDETILTASIITRMPLQSNPIRRTRWRPSTAFSAENESGTKRVLGRRTRGATVRK